MKKSPLSWVLAGTLCLTALSSGQGSGTAFTNFVRQHQYPSHTERDMSVTASGLKSSALAIDPGGARFELWTVKNTNPPTAYLLDSKFVSTYVPVASVKVWSDDTTYTSIPRTRADKPFYVEIETNGLSSDPNAPEASRMVNLLHHVQSYGTKGDGLNVNRTQATLRGSQPLVNNGKFKITFAITDIPGTNRAKIRGEERVSVFSLEDFQAPQSQLASKFIQIWPVTDGTISGITNNQLVRFKMPTITVQLNDIYPGSSNTVQVYKGAPSLGKEGINVPVSYTNTKAVPDDKTLIIDDFTGVFDEGGDGQWTLEVLNTSPFGIDRLAYVTFQLNRTIRFNGSITSQE
ncbi:hypothetical protein [Luteolibacter luteus]|uniref:P/Homo B domain-containing protein n=1 Tax=Luteolibacter luteus TaxID=2728835 RepID=A0A858RLD6_9BACT|nr:hypothetical protein [Luteolibacter luteus]QJE97652.1 hypothetical protein HHL09_18330 [Luteolibacter luteus]